VIRRRLKQINGVKRKIDTTDIVQERTKKIKHDNFTASVNTTIAL